MRSYNSAVLALLLLLGFACSADAQEYARSYPVSGRASVRVRADNAGVHIITSDTPKVEFDVRYDEDAAPNIDSHQAGNVTEISVFAQRRWWPSFGSFQHLGIEVHMPKNGDLHVETSNGAVDVASLDGSLVVRTSNGGIRVRQVTGSIEISSSNGGITLDALKGTVKAGTTNGAIRADELDGQCRLSTTNGSVHASGRFDALEISSGNGAIVARAEAGSTVSSEWAIHTTNSSVNLSIPKDLKANFVANTTNGRVTIDLPNEGGFHGETHVRTALNGGGHELSVHTTNGAIHLSGI
jgi:DUF4097 and DUF4098 domain-containing protein YvlB